MKSNDKDASSTESGSKEEKSNASKSKVDNASESSAGNSAKDEGGSNANDKDAKPDKKEGRKLQKLLKMLRGELKEKSSKHLLDKAEKLAKGIFKKRKSADGKEGNRAMIEF